ncbi:MAG: NAD(P)H-dependent oxidoreductase subunit E, partial [Anaerolineaceae bacterium]|nr:NAD(P)H-dependent oxidoreductase subunit E [Anaerolineaceae bacterium]
MDKQTSITQAELVTWREKILSERDASSPCIMICGGTGCLALNSQEVADALEKALKEQDVAAKVELKTTGCPGFCEQGPLAVIHPARIFYTRLKPEDATEIVSKTIVNGEIIDRLLYTDPLSGKKITYETDVPFYKEQKRILLKESGLIDPKKIEDYIAAGGYKSVAKALFEMTPEQVIAEIKKSGLRGRGGAGFPTGLKWEFCRKAEGDSKYIICNADEGDPGAFQDRGIIEGNPHSILEGMIIGAYAIGARTGIIYIRNEYPLAVELIRLAVQQASEYGLLGENILGSGFSFDIEIQLGAGAFVCGEETALMASIEGRVGEPRSRPPYPAQ